VSYNSGVGDDRMVQIGAPALGEDFHDRTRELETLKKRILSTSILLTAPRRFGKTSLLRKFEKQMKEERYNVIYLDVMHVYSPERFVHELALAAYDEASIRDKFLQNIKEIFKKLAGALNIEGSVPGASIKLELSRILESEVNEKTWQDHGREIIKSITASSEKTPVIIILDELPEAVANMSREDRDALGFLQWFRSIRQSIDNIRFIVAGSTSFENVVKSISKRGSYINDLHRIDLSGFSYDDAMEFLKKAFKDEELPFSEDVGRRILELVGEPYVPYFLAVFVGLISEELREVSEPDAILNSLEELYWSKLLGNEGSRYFQDYWDRLRIYYSEYLTPVREILNEASKSDEGIRVDTAKEIFIKYTELSSEEVNDKFNVIIKDLENDFYLQRRGEYLVFQSKLMKDWWRLNHG